MRELEHFTRLYIAHQFVNAEVKMDYCIVVQWKALISNLWLSFLKKFLENASHFSNRTRKHERWNTETPGGISWGLLAQSYSAHQFIKKCCYLNRTWMVSQQGVYTFTLSSKSSIYFIHQLLRFLPLTTYSICIGYIFYWLFLPVTVFFLFLRLKSK